MTDDRLEPIPAPLYDPRHEHDACGVGFVTATDGRNASRTVPMALEALAALAHRGARAADDTTGDGAGISIPISPRFPGRLLDEAGLTRASRRRTAVAMCFLPPAKLGAGTALVEAAVADAGLRVAGWREVPVDRAMVDGRRVGETPVVRQAIVVTDCRLTGLELDQALALARRSIEATTSATPGLEELAVPSLSDVTITYKGLFVGDELGGYYRDRQADDLDAHYAIFHQRYSTNTFPSWRLVTSIFGSVRTPQGQPDWPEARC